ncbi:MAG: PQQ-dependent sugar dehydrogenase [Chloroflexi bacterium]|nr:PQQ-dependent sugar dehydrogenase [Chloroflexota bacterium]
MSKRIYQYPIIALVIVLVAGVFTACKPAPVSSVPPEVPPPPTAPNLTIPPATPPAAPPPAATDLPGPPSTPQAPAPAVSEPITIIARNLQIPWSLDFLPDGSIIFTERPGRIRLLDAKRGLLQNPLLTVADVAARGEGGLLGIAVHPDFSENRFIYIYHTYQGQPGLANRVLRFKMDGDYLAVDKVIIEGIPAASIHDGGRLKFGPDGLLYITTGDAAQPDLAQDKNSLAGKILRLKDDGSIPADNPFPGSPVYSYGHRNPQGLAWDDRGRLWETEHGSSTRDELNLIQAGKNYGWPAIRGDEAAPGMEKPVLHSGDDTWAPSGLAFLNGSLYFAGLRGQSLFQVVLKGEQVELRRHLSGQFGRLRDVVIGPDRFLYLLTNDRDGRGAPATDDDLIIRVDPARLAP